MSLTTERQEGDQGAGSMPTGKEEGSSEEEEAVAASAAFAFLARPVSLLRHVAHGCTGYLLGLQGLPRRRRRRPCSAPAAVKQQDGDEAAADEVLQEAVVVEVRPQAMPQRPRGLREGRGGSGGAHN